MERKLYFTTYNLKSLRLTKQAQFAIAAGIGFDGIEGGLFCGTLDDEEQALLDRFHLGLCIGSLIRRADGTADPEQVRRLKAAGVQTVVVRDQELKPFSLDLSHGFRGLPGIVGTHEAALAAAEAVRADAEFAGRYGFDVYYHNHTVEFRKDGGRYLIDTYLDAAPANVKLELDVGWLMTAGVEPVSFIRGHAGRIAALHIKACCWPMGPEALGMHCPVPPVDQGVGPDQQKAIQTAAEWPQGPMADSICDWAEVISTAEEAGCHVFIIERERIYNEPQEIIACLQADHDHIRACFRRLSEAD